MRLVLASRSPRRREILTALGLEFELIEPDVDEVQEGDPAEVVMENARRKAAAGLAGSARDALILGVDTEVVLDRRTLGKPAGPDEARQYLLSLSGRSHEVLSGLVLLGPIEASGQAPERSGLARSRVTFRRLDRETLELYLGSGEWRDRAGAYAIQGLGSVLIEEVRGDFSNVVGLPVRLLLELAPELRPPRAGSGPTR